MQVLLFLFSLSFAAALSLVSAPWESPSQRKASVKEPGILINTVINTHDRDAFDLREMSYHPPAETLSYIIQAGEVLIFNLPEVIEGREIDSYRLKESPALSWLVEKSFFWRTLANDVGQHEILLSVIRNGIVIDELVVQVDIR